SVYAEPMPENGDENSPLARLDDPTTEEVTNETYGGLKVLCEQVVSKRYGDSALVIRPTYVVGPYDYTYRFTYWVDRIAAGGPVLAPEPRDYGIQVIDARDQAVWAIDMLEKRQSGTFHTVSPEPRFTFEQMLEAIVSAVGPVGTSLVWVDREFLIDQAIDGEHLPLWPGPDFGDYGMALDPGRATSVGLAPRPLSQTIVELLEQEQKQPTPDGNTTGLSREREAELLRTWGDRRT
ncbi:MAG TPA: hypothetical protein VMT88_12890, partial [Actinomycetes bacterium]|nr:hypothetical protein [Actinomycetes bacterium]